MSSVTQTYGANIAFIEELYERYRANPESVSASWREFFHDYTDGEERVATAAPAVAPPAAEAAAATRPTPVPPLVPGATPLRGAAAKIVTNMEASLGVPTATSVRNMPDRKSVV